MTGIVSHNDTKTHTAAYKLFHYYYGFMVPDSEFYDRNDLEFFGIPVAGSEEQAAAIAATMNPRHLRISEMAEIAKTGCKWGLVTPSVSVEIYNILVEHLNDWVRAVNFNEVDGRDIPIDGLKSFNIMAKEMFKVATNCGLIEKYQNPSSIVRLTSGETRANKSFPKHHNSAFGILERAYNESTKANKKQDSVFNMTENGKLLVNNDPEVKTKRPRFGSRHQ